MTIAAIAPGYAAGQQTCDPTVFMVREEAHIVWSDDMKILFLQSATRGQYDKVKDTWKSGGSYGPYSGYLDYDKAKTSARKEAEFRKLTFQQHTNLDYLSQRLSPEAVRMYGECLEKDKSSPGIRIWLRERKGDDYYLNVFWVGNDSKMGEGKETGTPIERKLKILQRPNSWPKGDVQEIVVTKAPTDDGYIGLEISGQTKGFTLLGEMPEMTSALAHGKSVKVASGGHGGKTCGAGRLNKAQSCVLPSHPGGYLVPGSVAASGDDLKTNASERNCKTTVVEDTPLRACVEFEARTDACETLVYIQGRATAVERYPAQESAVSK